MQKNHAMTPNTLPKRLCQLWLGLAIATASLLAAATDSTEAEVRKVDLSAGKITLKHDEIKNLDMPPMTMVFQVPKPALLGSIKAGDRVRFTADKVNGAYTVLTLELAK
jgi:Cu(I)/Ag(I) efflux system periplasmic protein CusF